MKRSPSARLLRSLVVGSGLVLLAVSIGCIDQAEGDRCSTLTGTDSDCEVGLRCTPASELNLTGGANGDGRCSPDRTQATTDVCRINVSPAAATRESRATTPSAATREPTPP
ncbi:MAG: hypothetical protein U0169_15520 [Polyangiaceae bacterium]